MQWALCRAVRGRVVMAFNAELLELGWLVDQAMSRYLPLDNETIAALMPDRYARLAGYQRRPGLGGVMSIDEARRYGVLAALDQAKRTSAGNADRGPGSETATSVGSAAELVDALRRSFHRAVQVSNELRDLLDGLSLHRHCVREDAPKLSVADCLALEHAIGKVLELLLGAIDAPAGDPDVDTVPARPSSDSAGPFEGGSS